MSVVRENIVISTWIPLRGDGLPYANMREPSDPGAAVYWLERGEWDTRRFNYCYTPRVMACDRWLTVRDNLRAIALSLEALRALKRAGATQILERAFQGFTALPSDTKPKSWREVLGITARGDRAYVLELVERAYRALALEAHPDRGGSHERMVALNRAREEALRELL